MDDPTDVVVDAFERLGQGRAAVDELVDSLHSQLRALARRQIARRGASPSLRPTELVQEAYLRLIGQRDVRAEQRTLFLGAAAAAMRRVLLDHARVRRARKRGEGGVRVELSSGVRSALPRSTDVLDLAQALEELRLLNPLRARVAELTLFAEIGHAEVASVLAGEGHAVTAAHAGRLWRTSRAWLARRLRDGES